MAYKFEIVKDQIIDILSNQQWKPGDKFFSENQLALKLGCSRQTVRKSVKMLVDQEYLVKVQGSGTYVGEQILNSKTLRTQSVGILVTYLSDYIFPLIIRNLEETFSAAGYSVQLASSGNSSMLEGEQLRKMLDNNVDGIILEPTRSALPNPNLSTYRKLLNDGFPLVTIHSSYNMLDIPTISLDDRKAGYLAASHLIKLGHKKIAAVLKSDDLQGHRRYEGILEAHDEHHLIFDDKHVYWYTTEDVSALSNEVHDRILNRIDGCTAVVSYNDQIGILLEELFISHGCSIPDDISIISIDNSKYAPLAPVPLTSVASPIEEIGKSAAEHLLKQIRGESFPERITFEPELIVRDSTQALDKT